MVTNIFIQARLNSTRFPGKVLKTIHDEETILDFQIRRLEKVKGFSKIVVLTSNNSTDDKLVKHCKKMNYLYFRGSLDNVYKRFIDATLKYKCDAFVRLTADCPLINPDIVSEIIDIHKKNYLTYKVTGLSGEFPDGFDCSIISAKPFIEDYSINFSDFFKEHITQYYEMEERNKVFFYEKYVGFGDLRLSVDYPDDLKLIKFLIEKLDEDELKNPKVLSEVISSNKKILDFMNQYQKNIATKTYRDEKKI